MALRTINHPGVEIREYDFSNYTSLVGGTTSLIMGFAATGEDVSPFLVTSIQGLESYFGVPTNEAERYFYYGCRDVITKGGTLIAAKIPYNNASSQMFKTCSYTVNASAQLSAASASGIITAMQYTAVSGVTPDYTGYVTSSDFAGYDSYLEIESSTSTLSASIDTVEGYRSGTLLPPSGEFILIEKNKTNLAEDMYGNSNGEVIGIFPVVVTALNALPVQGMLNMTAADRSYYSAIKQIATADVAEVDNMVYELSNNTYTGDTFSRVVASEFPGITYASTASGADYVFDTYNMNKVMVAIVKMKTDPNSNNKINFSIVERFVGSLDKNSKHSSGESNYIGNIINTNSKYVEFYGNIPTTRLAGTSQFYTVAPQTSIVLGFTKAESNKYIRLSDITTSMDTIFSKLDNIDELEIDTVVDCGLSNIAQYAETSDQTADPTLGVIYDPDGRSGMTYTRTIGDTPTTVTPAWSNRIDKLPSGESAPQTSTWKNVLFNMINFCANSRKDCMLVADGLRNFALEGSKKIVRPGSSANVDVDLIPYLKYMTGVNSNFGSLDITFLQRVDGFTGLTFWCPPSIFRNNAIITTDYNFNYWDAPAGFTRGIAIGAVDVAFNPNGKQQDAIYSKSFNYAMNYPSDGIILEGQKTLQTKPSAFDRINVRRLFLRLERFTYRTVKYYKYEVNNSNTRTRIYDQLVPIFERVKTSGGIYDYKIIIDDINNTPEVIDNNELRVAILVKPAKTAEFIIVDFYALSTGMSFSELTV